MNGEEELNTQALYAFRTHNFNLALELFERNAKLHPSHLTYNNLGVYMTEDTGYSEVAFKYVSDAGNYAKSLKNFMALGDLYFEHAPYRNDSEEIEFYKKAEKYYYEALEFFPNYITLNNLACLELIERDYNSAVRHFEQAKSMCGNAVDLLNMDIALIFIYTETNAEKEALELLNAVAENELVFSTEKLLDYNNVLFDFYFRCKKYESAYSFWRKAEKNEYPVMYGYNGVSMVLECLFKLNKQEEAAEFLNRQLELISDFDKELYDRELINKIFVEEELRNHFIKKYRFVPVKIDGCHYIGCTHHNTPCFSDKSSLSR